MRHHRHNTTTPPPPHSADNVTAGVTLPDISTALVLGSMAHGTDCPDISEREGGGLFVYWDYGARRSQAYGNLSHREGGEGMERDVGASASRQHE